MCGALELFLHAVCPAQRALSTGDSASLKSSRAPRIAGSSVQSRCREVVAQISTKYEGRVQAAMRNVAAQSSPCRWRFPFARVFPRFRMELPFLDKPLSGDAV